MDGDESLAFLKRPSVLRSPPQQFGTPKSTCPKQTADVVEDKSPASEVKLII